MSAAVLAVAGATILIQAHWAQQACSITHDETFYAGCAQHTVFERRLDPRLAQNGTAPLPILVCYLAPAWLITDGPRPNPWEGLPSDLPLVAAARVVNAVVVGLSLMLLVFVWLARRRGLAAATCGAALVATSPALLAHVSLAATDALFAVTTTAALAVLAWHASQPSPRRFMTLVVAVAVACATKYSAAFLVPTTFLVLTIARHRPGDQTLLVWAWRSAWWAGGQAVLLAILVFPTTWAMHLFGLASFDKSLTVAQTPWLTRPAPLAGAIFQYIHNREGHPAFLMGQHSNTGWWYYFPCVLFFKSTPAEWLLAVLAVCPLARVVRGGGSRRSVDLSLCAWLFGGGFYLLMLMTSRINIGHRYVLPLYPLLYLAGVDQIWVLFPRRWTRATLAIVAVAVQATSAAWIAPQYLAYFSPVVGGPREGHHLLVDSNIDWGQDLIALRGELERLGYERVVLKYFGTASPQAYGITADRWDDGTMTWPAGCHALVVSITFLQGAYGDGRDPFRELRAVSPVGRAGYSLMVYDLHDPAVQKALHTAKFRLRAGSTNQPKTR